MTNPDETWDEWYDRTTSARVAEGDQAVAAFREKIERLLPELDPGPRKAQRHLALVSVPQYRNSGRTPLLKSVPTTSCAYTAAAIRDRPSD